MSEHLTESQRIEDRIVTALATIRREWDHMLPTAAPAQRLGGGSRSAQITADDHRLFAVQLPDINAEIILPLQAVFQTGEAALGVGGIDIHQLKFIILQRDDPAFLVMFRHAHAVGNRQRLEPRKNGCAGIPFLYGAVPKLFIASKADFRLPGLHLCFLNADDIGVRRNEKIGEAFIQTCSKSIDVP